MQTSFDNGKNKGLYNRHTIVSNDFSNITNQNNTQVFANTLSGHHFSPLFMYLVNMNKQRLNDFKSIMFYNQSNLASLMGETMPLQEIDNCYIIRLPKPKSKRKTEPFLNILKSRKSTRSFAKYTLDMNYSYQK